MKIRSSFVGNSSSTSFIIKNKTDSIKTALDLAKETVFLVEFFNAEFDREVDEQDYIKASKKYQSYTWYPKETKIVSFGDNDGNAMGLVLDYMLRGKDDSKSFEWDFHHYER